MKQELKDNKKEVSELLSRGAAIKKIGGYAALTALGTFMILNPQKAQAQSISEGGYDNSTGCQDSSCLTGCDGCSGVQDPNCNCIPADPDPPEPFQGNTTTKGSAGFESKYKLKYRK